MNDRHSFSADSGAPDTFSIACPTVLPLSSILPEEPLLMMGAGPVPIPDAVARANGVVINHLGSTMAAVIGQVKTMARYVFQTESKWVMGVAGPGSAAMEMAITNLAWKDSRVLCICNGFFSERMAEMARRTGAQVETLNVVDGTAAHTQQAAHAIDRFRPEIVTIVHGETSNTVWNRSLESIASVARAAGALVIVDAVCTLSTMPLPMDAWGIDAVITGGQKGLSSIPGVSLLAFSEKAWQRILSRPVPPTHWCLDAALATNFWHNASYHYTAPVSGVLALHEALRLVCAETLERRFARHRRCSNALQAGVEALCSEAEPAEFGRGYRVATGRQWFRRMCPHLAPSSCRDCRLVRRADRTYRPDGRAMPRASSLQDHPCAWPDHDRPRRAGGSARRRGRAGALVVGGVKTKGARAFDSQPASALERRRLNH